APALMQVVRRKCAPVLLQLPRGRAPRRLARKHMGLARDARAFAQIADSTRRDDVLPCRPPAAAARDNVVERQVRRRPALAAILAAEGVAQEYVEARERGLARGR